MITNDKYTVLYGSIDKYSDVSTIFNNTFVTNQSIYIPKDTKFNTIFGDPFPNYIKELLIYKNNDDFYSPDYIIGEHDCINKSIYINPTTYYNVRTTTVSHHGFRITAYNNDDLSKNFIYSINGEWESHITELVSKLLQKDDIVIDAGANIGYHTLTFSYLVPDGHVYAFEPQKQNYKLLEKNVNQNDMNNVTLFYKALGNKCDNVKIQAINTGIKNNMGDISVNDKEGHYTVECTTIDNLNLSKLDFIKINVQGFEKYVLDGGKQTISKTKPFILVEIEDAQLQKFGYNSAELLEKIKDVGYNHIYLVDYKYPSDFLCIPDSRYEWFIDRFGTLIGEIIRSSYINNTYNLGIRKKIILPSSNGILYNSPFKKTLRVAFHSNQIGIRGTEVAMYDYANYNETLLNNKSFIISRQFSPFHDHYAMQKYKDRFGTIMFYNVWDEVEKFIETNQIDVLYMIKSGEDKEPISKKCKTVIHCVFNMNNPHGSVYAAISPLVKNYNLDSLCVPHMVFLPEIDLDMKNSLKIPQNATVFGYHGGSYSFNIDYVHNVIQNFAENNPNTYFIFLNINNFCKKELPNIIFLPGTADMMEKTTFINTCDAMIHARIEGETFGLAVGEFSIKNKPVITTDICTDIAHIKYLGNNAMIYRNADDLYNIFKTFDRNNSNTNQLNAYIEYTPEKVMKIFKNIFLD